MVQRNDNGGDGEPPAKRDDGASEEDATSDAVKRRFEDACRRYGQLSGRRRRR